MGVSNDTAAKAFDERQANGIIVVIQPAPFDANGKGKCPEYEITETAKRRKDGRCLFRDWKPNFDFPIIKVQKENKIHPNNHYILLSHTSVLFLDIYPRRSRHA